MARWLKWRAKGSLDHDHVPEIHTLYIPEIKKVNGDLLSGYPTHEY
jgi:hypothetical protein